MTHTEHRSNKSGRTLTLALLFLMALMAFFFASAQNTYAADNQPKDLRWNANSPSIAEWEWTGGTSASYPSRVDVTVKYESSDNDPNKTDTMTIDHYAVEYKTSSEGVTRCEFYPPYDTNNRDFFEIHGEGYYSFWLDIYDSDDGTEPVQYTTEKSLYRTVEFNEEIQGEDGKPYPYPNKVDRTRYYSLNQEDDAGYRPTPRILLVLPADRIVRLKQVVEQPGFSAVKFEHGDDITIFSETNEKISFRLDKNVKVTAIIRQDTRTVPVTIDFGTGHEDIAEATAEEITDPGYSAYDAYAATVSGSVVTIAEWPQATKVKDLKELVVERIYDKCTTEGFRRTVVDGDEVFRGDKIGKKKISEYSGEQEYNAETAADEDADMPNDGLALYVLWDKVISEASFSVEAPVCGTEVTADGSGAPEVAAAEGSPVGYDRKKECCWLKDGEKYTGKIEGGEKYTADFFVDAPFGTWLDLSVDVKVNGQDAWNEYEGGHLRVRTEVDAVHDWGDPTYEWATDNSTATAVRPCKGDASHNISETVSATSEVTKQETCTEAGETTYTAEFTKPFFVTQVKTVADIDELGHDWEAPTYEWAEDNSTVTATRVCSRDSRHVETETAQASSQVTKQETCTEEGDTTYTAEFINPGFATQTKTLTDRAALDHDWGDPTYEWAEDNSTVTATRVCSRNASHTETETATVTSEVTKQETCTEAGETTYTAAFTKPFFVTQVKTVADRAALDHDWGDPTYEWAEDNSTVTATRVCSRNASHTETETATVTSEVTKQETCTEAGETTYTAEFTSPVFATQTKTLANIDALGHTWGEGVVTKEPTENEEGVRTYTCSVCGETKTESIERLAPKQAAGQAEVYDKALPKVKIKKPVKLKKAVRVKWTKLSSKNRKKCAGIEIEIKGPGIGTKIVTASKKATSKKIGKLARKKTYQVRVRSYKNVGNVKHVGKWSKYRKVKTK